MKLHFLISCLVYLLCSVTVSDYKFLEMFLILLIIYYYQNKVHPNIKMVRYLLYK